jgi:transposase-like protein
MVSQSRKEFLVGCVDWKRIKAEYIAGGTSYRKLCEKYGVSRTTLQRKAKDEKWCELRSQAEAKTETKIIESVSDKEADKVSRIITVADKVLAKIEDVLEFVQDTQSIKHITSALKDLKEIKGFKSDADMREQEARIRNLERQAEANDSNEDIVVQIGSDAEEYSG